jgi:hypothetical protein
MMWWRVRSMAAMAARAAAVFPDPDSPVMTPIAPNPAELHQMHDLVSCGLRRGGNSAV